MSADEHADFENIMRMAVKNKDIDVMVLNNYIQTLKEYQSCHTDILDTRNFGFLIDEAQCVPCVWSSLLYRDTMTW